MAMIVFSMLKFTSGLKRFFKKLDPEAYSKKLRTI